MRESSMFGGENDESGTLLPSCISGRFSSSSNTKGRKKRRNRATSSFLQSSENRLQEGINMLSSDSDDEETSNANKAPRADG